MSPDALSRGSFDPAELLRALIEHGVDFVVVGGVAGGLHGASRVTFDLDIAYDRRAANLERLAYVLRSLDARLSGPGVPQELPFELDAVTLSRGRNFSFTTRAGRLDIFAELAGAPSYEALAAGAAVLDLAEVGLAVADLDQLIARKRATGRAKDRLDADEYIELARLRREQER